MTKYTLEEQIGIIQSIQDYGINVDTREIYLHSYIGNLEEEPGVDYRIANSFIKNLHYLDSLNNDNILIHLCVGGGDWNYGACIYDAIKFSNSYVTILVYAHAYSMTSIITQAADLRIITPTTDFMIHYGSISLEANSISAKSTVDWNNYLNKIMVEIYADKCQHGPFFKDGDYTIAKVKKYLETKMKQTQDWYLNAEDAKRYGLVDEILGQGKYKTMDLLRNQ